MTKQQLKEKYTEWNINNGGKDKRNTEIFREMQELNFSSGNSKWCNMDMLLQDLILTRHKSKAFELYQEYYENKGRMETFKELAISTHNFEINK